MRGVEDGGGARELEQRGARVLWRRLVEVGEVVRAFVLPHAFASALPNQIGDVGQSAISRGRGLPGCVRRRGGSGARVWRVPEFAARERGGRRDVFHVQLEQDCELRIADSVASELGDLVVPEFAPLAYGPRW